MTCAAKRGSQLRNGLSSAIRTPLVCSAEFWEFCIVVSHLSQRFPHDRWPCDHPQVVLAESLPVPHMPESPRLEVISYPVHYRNSKWFCENRDLWWNQQELEWSTLRDLSVHNTSLPFDHSCCLNKSELETRLRFPVSRSRNRKLQSELSFLFPLPPTFQFDVVHQHLDLRHKPHTNSCKHHVLNLHVIVSLCSWNSSDSPLLWEFLL